MREMTILGRHPDGVIDYTYEGTTYHFWHYDNLDIVKYLEHHPDVSYDSVTLRQLIEVRRINAPDSQEG